MMTDSIFTALCQFQSLLSSLFVANRTTLLIVDIEAKDIEENFRGGCSWYECRVHQFERRQKYRYC